MTGFSEVYAGDLPGVYYGSAAWGDVDSDGDLDILLTGDGGSGRIAKIYRNDDCPGIYLPLVLRSNGSAGVPAHRSSGETTCNPSVPYQAGADRSQMHDALARLATAMGPTGSASFPAAGMDEENARLGACLLTDQAPPGRRQGARRRRAPS